MAQCRDYVGRFDGYGKFVYASTEIRETHEELILDMTSRDAKERALGERQ